MVEQSKIWIPYQDGPYQLPLVDQVEKCLETRNCSHLSELTSTFRGNIEVAKVSAGGRRKTKGGYPEEKNAVIAVLLDFVQITSPPPPSSP